MARLPDALPQSLAASHRGARTAFSDLLSAPPAPHPSEGGGGGLPELHSRKTLRLEQARQRWQARRVTAALHHKDKRRGQQQRRWQGQHHAGGGGSGGEGEGEPALSAAASAARLAALPAAPERLCEDLACLRSDLFSEGGEEAVEEGGEDDGGPHYLGSWTGAAP
jgi:hypothetical protein